MFHFFNYISFVFLLMLLTKCYKTISNWYFFCFSVWHSLPWNKYPWKWGMQSSLYQLKIACLEPEGHYVVIFETGLRPIWLLPDNHRKVWCIIALKIWCEHNLLHSRSLAQLSTPWLCSCMTSFSLSKLTDHNDYVKKKKNRKAWIGFMFLGWNHCQIHLGIW